VVTQPWGFERGPENDFVTLGSTVFDRMAGGLSAITG